MFKVMLNTSVIFADEVMIINVFELLSFTSVFTMINFVSLHTAVLSWNGM